MQFLTLITIDENFKLGSATKIMISFSVLSLSTNFSSRLCMAFTYLNSYVEHVHTLVSLGLLSPHKNHHGNTNKTSETDNNQVHCHNHVSVDRYDVYRVCDCSKKKTS